MTEEQLQRIKDEAEIVARMVLPFAERIAVTSSNSLAAYEFVACVSFVSGARFGFRLAKEEKHDQV